MEERNSYSELSLAELYLLMKEVAEAYVERATQARENLSIVSKEIDKVEHKLKQVVQTWQVATVFTKN